MEEVTNLTQSTLSLHSTLLLALYVLTGVYVIFSAVLYYHWQNYSSDERVSKITLITFFVSTFPLLLIMSLILLTI
jgi:uncharacterized membrane protein